MARRQVGLKLEPELLARVDASAAERGETRTALVERALESLLSLREVSAAAVERQAAGILAAPVEGFPDPPYGEKVPTVADPEPLGRLPNGDLDLTLPPRSEASDGMPLMGRELTPQEVRRRRLNR